MQIGSWKTVYIFSLAGLSSYQTVDKASPSPHAMQTLSNMVVCAQSSQRSQLLQNVRKPYCIPAALTVAFVRTERFVRNAKQSVKTMSKHSQRMTTKNQNTQYKRALPTAHHPSVTVCDGSLSIAQGIRYVLESCVGNLLSVFAKMHNIYKWHFSPCTNPVVERRDPIFVTLGRR